MIDPRRHVLAARPPARVTAMPADDLAVDLLRLTASAVVLGLAVLVSFVR